MGEHCGFTKFANFNINPWCSNDRTEEELKKIEEKFQKSKFEIIIPEIKTITAVNTITEEVKQLDINKK